MRVACPKCSNIDIDCVFSVEQNETERYYGIFSKCNSCGFKSNNYNFWFDNGKAEIIRKRCEVNKVEKENWEKKNS